MISDGMDVDMGPVGFRTGALAKLGLALFGVQYYVSLHIFVAKSHLMYTNCIDAGFDMARLRRNSA